MVIQYVLFNMFSVKQYKNPLAICYVDVTVVVTVTSEDPPPNIEVKYCLQTQYNINRT